jgi:hypothetical protein
MSALTFNLVLSKKRAIGKQKIPAKPKRLSVWAATPRSRFFYFAVYIQKHFNSGGSPPLGSSSDRRQGGH